MFLFASSGVHLSNGMFENFRYTYFYNRITSYINARTVFQWNAGGLFAFKKQPMPKISITQQIDSEQGAYYQNIQQTLEQLGQQIEMSARAKQYRKGESAKFFQSVWLPPTNDQKCRRMQVYRVKDQYHPNR